MAIKISGDTVIGDDRRGSFVRLNAGAYTQQQLTDLVVRGIAVGDSVYNQDTEAVNYWDGTKWIPIPNTCGEIEYRNPGTYTFVPPAGVTKVHVVCVGGGGAGGAYNYKTGGGGGGLGWRNNIAVTPGTAYTVVVGKGGVFRNGEDGGDSYFVSPNIVKGGGGKSGNKMGAGGNYVGQGGGAGGGTDSLNIVGHAGGGAGGYRGAGGAAMNNCGGRAGSGGGAGAGTDSGVYWGMRGTGGGGTGIYGEGVSGKQSFTIWEPNASPNGSNWRNYCANIGGFGGSPAHGTGTNGQTGSYQTSRPWAGGNGNGGFPGGGGGQQEGGQSNNNNAAGNPGQGGGGAVRIIWGQNRAFPSSGVGKDDCPETPAIPVDQPTMVRAGTIPSTVTVSTVNSSGPTITISGATKVDGTYPSTLYYAFKTEDRSTGNSDFTEFTTNPSITSQGSKITYQGFVKAVDSTGRQSEVLNTNLCTIMIPPAPSPTPTPPPVNLNECGMGEWSGPINPPIWSGTARANASRGSVIGMGRSYSTRRISQYTAFFTEDSSDLEVQVYRNNVPVWERRGAQVIVRGIGGGGVVRATATTVIHMVSMSIEHRKVGSGSGSSSNSGAHGRSNEGYRPTPGEKTAYLLGDCRGNSSHITTYAACVFDRTGHHIHGTPSEGGFGGIGDNYAKMKFKFWDQHGSTNTNCRWYTQDPNKIIAIASRTFTMESS